MEVKEKQRITGWISLTAVYSAGILLKKMYQGECSACIMQYIVNTYSCPQPVLQILQIMLSSVKVWQHTLYISRKPDSITISTLNILGLPWTGNVCTKNTRERLLLNWEVKITSCTSCMAVVVTDMLLISVLSLIYSAVEYYAPVWLNSPYTNKIEAQLHESMSIVGGTIWTIPTYWLPVLSHTPYTSRSKTKNGLFQEYLKIIEMLNCQFWEM